MKPNDPRRVRIKVEQADTEALFWLDVDTPPSLEGGYGGWQDQPRDRRRALLTWQGPPSWILTLPVLIDGHGDLPDGLMENVRRQWQVLEALWSSPAVSAPPPLARIEGKALILPATTDPEAHWALTDVAPREQDHRTDDGSGDLIRWAGVLTFGRVAPREVLRITRGPNAGKRIHIVKAGETLASIARAEHVKPGAITYANGKKIRDPKKVKLHDHLRLPPRTAA